MEIETSSIVVERRCPQGEDEPGRPADLEMGELARLDHPMGSGETDLISHVERFSDANSSSGPRVLDDEEDGAQVRREAAEPLTADGDGARLATARQAAMKRLLEQSQRECLDETMSVLVHRKLREAPA